ncbi:ribonuclease J [Alicyclobacillus macrosporangiidus]|uniref:Ribonuclease J n=1 Tax=Alicyclobacillus macrosporangiidus TaxID=392015 RepID=A0A1I7IFP1_9BACL|nr:ribonuclease J [Alicyclobacillus macrosporangiidus]
MSRVTWQFFQGIGTIGGTVIRIAVDGHRLLFDMGRVFSPAVPVFDSVLAARGIRDLQRMGLAPCIPGLFEGDGTDAPAGVRTMVAISHSHLDHTGLLPYLREDIPVLLTEDTHRLLRALDEVLDGPRRNLAYQPVPCGETVSFGPMRITPVAVDHDTPGACGFFIETPELRFVYSGDLRLHGAHPERTRDFARAARAFRPDVLFIEGTRADTEDNSQTLYEAELARHAAEVMQAAEAGVYFTFYPRHPQRAEAFHEAARASGRRLLLSAPSAYLYAAFGGDLSDIAIYGGGEESWTEAARAFVTAHGFEVVRPAELRGREHAFAVELGYERFIDWIDIDAKPGGVFIHSNGSPLGPYDPAWNNMLHWLEVFGLRLALVGSTGHGARDDILSIVETIQPRVLMPIHSMNPGRIGLPTVPRILPAYGRIYTADDLTGAIPPTEEELQ